MTTHLRDGWTLPVALLAAWLFMAAYLLYAVARLGGAQAHDVPTLRLPAIIVPVPHAAA